MRAKINRMQDDANLAESELPEMFRDGYDPNVVTDKGMEIFQEEAQKLFKEQQQEKQRKENGRKNLHCDRQGHMYYKE